MVSNNPSALDLSASALKRAVQILIDHEYAVCAGDEDRADDLLAALEPEMRQLNWAQNEWLRNVSGDLHMLDGDETFLPLEMAVDDYRNALMQAWEKSEENPEEVLSLSRMEQSVFPEDMVAFMRWRSYAKLGFGNVAYAFLSHAIKLAPHNATYKIVILHTAYNAGDVQTAWPITQSIIDNHLDDTDSITMACSMMVYLLLGSDNSASTEMLETISQALIKISDETVVASISAPMRPFAPLMLGIAFTKLNRIDEANIAILKACQVDEEGVLSHTLRAYLMWGIDREAALSEFKKAVEANTKEALPYLVLAQNALQQLSYGECLRLCQIVMDIGDNLLRSVASQLLGVREMQMHGFTESAKKYLQDAIRLNPENQNLANQLKLIETNRRRQQRARLQKNISTRSLQVEFKPQDRAWNVSIPQQWIRGGLTEQLQSSLSTAAFALGMR